VRRVLVIRHGESTWNVERRWQGWLDAPLTPAGVEQAVTRARQLSRDGVIPRVVYTSDLERARRTAEIVANRLDAPLFPDLGFRERNGGEWQGQTVDEIEAGWPGMRDAWRRGELDAPPGGETDSQALARFDAALHRALAHVGDGMLLIVTHHGVLRVVANRAGAAVEATIPNLGGFWFEVDGGMLVDAEPVGELEPDGERPAVE